MYVDYICYTQAFLDEWTSGLNKAKFQKGKCICDGRNTFTHIFSFLKRILEFQKDHQAVSRKDKLKTHITELLECISSYLSLFLLGIHSKTILITACSTKIRGKMWQEQSRNQNKLRLAFGANNLVCSLLSFL